MIFSNYRTTDTADIDEQHCTTPGVNTIASGCEPLPRSAAVTNAEHDSTIVPDQQLEQTASGEVTAFARFELNCQPSRSAVNCQICGVAYQNWRLLLQHCDNTHAAVAKRWNCPMCKTVSVVRFAHFTSHLQHAHACRIDFSAYVHLALLRYHAQFELFMLDHINPSIRMHSQ